MCGIALLVQASVHTRNDLSLGGHSGLWDNLCSACADRGPDWSESTQITLPNNERDNGLVAAVYASVLHLRGREGREALTRQPHFGRDGSVFIWNGEIFEGLLVVNHENDGSKLFDMIQNSSGDISALMQILARIEGPYAFVYLHKPSETLYFARDPLGRRSLLFHPPTLSEPILILSSVANRARSMEYEEISTDGVFSVPLNRGLLLECMKNLTCTPRGASVFEGRVALNREIPLNPLCATSAEQIETFIFKLNESVESRVSNIPKNTFCSNSNNRPVARLGILFSGGIDCSVLAYLANRHIPPDEPIDLLNVAFENPRTLGAQKNAIQEARAQRKRSKRERKEVSQEAPLRPPPVQVEAPPEAEKYDVPDRLAGLEEVEELRRLCPDRQWNFVCVNVPYEECKREEPNVQSLMYPSRTVMDLSLALALYFASRGRGILHGSKDSGAEFYTSPAKVLLSGLGSDELLGGYSRHKQAYSRGGWDALVSELQLDLDRLPTRNLGRDDRVISAHGRESRYPFLSLTLVSYLAQLPVYIKLDPRLASTNGAVGSGMGDKTLLRLAAERLGLTLASKRIKRAMQFGSRSARMEGGNSEKKGHFLLE